MARVKFDLLRQHYPYDPPSKRDLFPCRTTDGAPAFENQCAIRMGTALRGAGVLPAQNTPGVVLCWHHAKGKGHTLRAEEVAKWLSAAARFGKPAKFVGTAPAPGEQALEAIDGVQGVILVKDFWGAGNQGDHIDLWDRDGMLSGSVDYLTRAAQVWFWELS